MRILLRDVSIAASGHDDVSMMHMLPATVTADVREGYPVLALVRSHVGSTARIKAAALIG